MRTSWILALALGCNGKGCQPDLPQPDETESDLSESDVSDSPTDLSDVLPDGPCPVPEAEPNDSPDGATPLPLESAACGAFQSPFDFDMWQFNLPQEGWLRVRVTAAQNGGWADARLTLDGPEVRSSVLIDNMHGSTDIDLRFPALAGDYTALLTEVNGQGAPLRYEYDLIASAAKPPVEWDLTGTEPDNSFAQAQRVASGDRVYADFGAIGDTDHYRIDVPPGKTTITIDVEAFAYGSAAWVALNLYNEGGTRLETWTRGPEGWEHDAQAVWTSSGDETLYLRTSDFAGASGLATWHVLSFTMEGE